MSFYTPKRLGPKGKTFWEYRITYTTASHTIFYNRYHIVWITKYRYKLLTTEMRLRIREISYQICEQLGVKIIKGLLSSNHTHMFVEIPPKLAVSNFLRRVKGCTSRKVQQEFPELKKQYWGQRFWARGYFCTTSGNVTNETIMNYIENHTLDEPTNNRR